MTHGNVECVTFITVFLIIIVRIAGRATLGRLAFRHIPRYAAAFVS